MQVKTGRFTERRCSIPADLAELPRARHFADRAATDFGFGESERYSIKMATSEAVANAIEHGSSSSAETVDLRAVDEGGALTFYVTDAGTFVPRVARGKTPERGRGLAFMGQLMDEVDVRPGREGTVVRYAKRLGS